MTDVDISDPAALQHHFDNNIPKLGAKPIYVTEIQVPEAGLHVDPTEIIPRPTNWWIPPNTPGSQIGRVWEIQWIPDPHGRGFDIPVPVEVNFRTR